MKKIGKNATIIVCTGLICIATIACFCAANDINGTVMTATIGSIVAIVGPVLGYKIGRKNNGS